MTEEKTVGRPDKYGEPTKVVSFRVPESHLIEIKQLVNQHLVKLERLNKQKMKAERTKLNI